MITVEKKYKCKCFPHAIPVGCPDALWPTRCSNPSSVVSLPQDLLPIWCGSYLLCDASRRHCNMSKLSKLDPLHTATQNVFLTRQYFILNKLFLASAFFQYLWSPWGGCQKVLIRGTLFSYQGAALLLWAITVRPGGLWEGWILRFEAEWCSVIGSCANHGLSITNTMFKHDDVHKWHIAPAHPKSEFNNRLCDRVRW